MESDIIRPLRDLLITPNFDDMIGGISEETVTNYDLIRESVNDYATLEKTDEHVVSLTYSNQLPHFSHFRKESKLGLLRIRKKLLIVGKQ